MWINCKIADLNVVIPEAGDLVPRCREYRQKEEVRADITIRTEFIQIEQWPGLSEDNAIYIETGMQFYAELLKYQGLMIHASAVEVDGKAYLFSGPCGTGKSTHTRLWQSYFGDAAQVFNDDKPAVRCVEGKWYAYGTPWCGKDGINQNKKIPLVGVCFLKQAPENKIRRLQMTEAMNLLISQTIRKFRTIERLDLMLSVVDKLVREIPFYELENRPDAEAVELSYETMSCQAKEKGL